MKKKTILMLICSLVLVVCLTFAVQADDRTNLLSEDYLTTPSGGEWSFVDGTLKCNNVAIGDTAIMSDVFIEAGEHVVIEASAVIDEGKAWGIILSEIDPNVPFASWVCLNMDISRPSTRLFGPGVNNPNEAELVNPAFVKGQSYSLALEITEDGEFYIYFNGEKYGERTNELWMGAYIGLMSWFGNVTYTDFAITHLKAGETYNPEKIELVIVEQPYDVRTMELGTTTNLLTEDSFKIQAGDGSFAFADGKINAPNAAFGDSTYMTDYFVDVTDHVYVEMTANISEGNAFGIMLPVLNYETPFDTWMCMNMEITRPSTRLFGPGFSEEIQRYSNDFTTNKDLTIGVEIDNGTFYLYTEGNLFGSITNSDWRGCYLGVMTWFSSCNISKFTVSDVKGATQYTVYPDGTTSGDAPAAEPVAEAPVVEEPVVAHAEPEVVTPSEPVVTAPVTTAPQTLDVSVILLAVSMITGGAAVSIKKRH